MPPSLDVIRSSIILQSSIRLTIVNSIDDIAAASRADEAAHDDEENKSGPKHFFQNKNAVLFLNVV